MKRFSTCGIGLAAGGRLIAQNAALGHLQAGVSGEPPGAAGDVSEHLPEAGGHDVVEDGVDGGAQVEAHAGDDVEVAKRLVVHVSPHQAVHVEGRPAEAEHGHQHTWMGRTREDTQDTQDKCDLVEM